MAGNLPGYSRRKVSKAGDLLAFGGGTDVEHADALEVLNDWRSAHGFPLNTIQMSLRKYAKSIHSNALVVQRLKRTESMIRKLKNEPTMKLAFMHDIGGCRAVLDSVSNVLQLRSRLERSRMKHELANVYDYIAHPKSSGYRSIHLVYKYLGRHPTDWDNLRIEVQIRSYLQHAWATAIETAGTYVRSELKSGEGDSMWLRFFALAGSAFALREGTEMVPGTPTDVTRLRNEILEVDAIIRARENLRAVSAVLKEIVGKQSGQLYFLLTLDAQTRAVYVRSFPMSQSQLAQREYLLEEMRFEDSPATQVVLVSTEKYRNLRRAYPNYFMDTKVFVRELDTFLRLGPTVPPVPRRSP